MLVTPAASLVNNPDGGGFQLGRPESPAFDSQGNLWVADTKNAVLLKYSDVQAMSGTVLNQPSTPLYNNLDAGFATPDGGANFGQVFGLAFDSAGNLWVSGSNLNQLLMYSNPSALSGVVAPAPAIILSNVQDGGTVAFGYPVGLAFDSQNNLWVPNEVLPSISKLAASQLTTSGAVQPAAQLINATLFTPFRNPEYLAFDQAGNLWVVDDNQAEEFAAADIASASGVEALDAGWIFFYSNDLGGMLVDPTPTHLPLYH